MKTTAPINLLAERAVRCAEQALASLAELVELLAQLDDERQAEQPTSGEQCAMSTSGGQLTNQERRVLTLVAAGLPNRKIAEHLDLPRRRPRR